MSNSAYGDWSPRVRGPPIGQHRYGGRVASRRRGGRQLGGRADPVEPGARREAFWLRSRDDGLGLGRPVCSERNISERAWVSRRDGRTVQRMPDCWPRVFSWHAVCVVVDCRVARQLHVTAGASDDARRQPTTPTARESDARRWVKPRPRPQYHNLY